MERVDEIAVPEMMRKAREDYLIAMKEEARREKDLAAHTAALLLIERRC